jgi:tRNA(Ile)-lysidine synthetase-like protein
MINLACPIPRDIVISVSGGPDSMSLLNFAQKGRKNIHVLHVDHKTEHAKEARAFVEKYCSDNRLPLSVYQVRGDAHDETNWRNERLEFYKYFTNQGRYIATAHTLDDAIEWFLFTAIHGQSAFMHPVSKEFKLLKPFLYTEKDELIKWNKTYNVPFVVDPTNYDNSNMRSKMRNSVIPELLGIHPGMKTSIKKKLIEHNG